MDQLATPSDAVREWAWNAGAERPEQAWLLHDWDVWVKNPHYTGSDVPHPEDYVPEFDEMTADQIHGHTADVSELEISLMHDVVGRPAHRAQEFTLPEPTTPYTGTPDDIPF
jgi:hypothetical protein